MHRYQYLVILPYVQFLLQIRIQSFVGKRVQFGEPDYDHLEWQGLLGSCFQRRSAQQRKHEQAEQEKGLEPSAAEHRHNQLSIASTMSVTEILRYRRLW
jgi:hypothetical protein